VDGDRSRRRVDRNRSHGWDGDGSNIGRRDHDRDVGRSAGGRDYDKFSGGRNLDDLRAGNSLVSVVGASTEFDSRAAGDANIIPSARIVLAAHAWTARAVSFAVGASAELDSRTTGDADVETGTGIVLAVSSGGSGVLGLVTTEKRETALVCSVSVLDL
jgi:hypothetical protein